MNTSLPLILHIDQFTLFLVLFSIGLCVAYHLIDLFFTEPTATGYFNALFLVGCLINSGYRQNTIGINVKGNFDLRNTPRCRWQPGQLEPANGFIVIGHFTFTLQDMDLHCGLVISGR